MPGSGCFGHREPSRSLSSQASTEEVMASIGQRTPFQMPSVQQQGLGPFMFAQSSVSAPWLGWQLPKYQSQSTGECHAQQPVLKASLDDCNSDMQHFPMAREVSARSRPLRSQKSDDSRSPSPWSGSSATGGTRQPESARGASELYIGNLPPRVSSPSSLHAHLNRLAMMIPGLRKEDGSAEPIHHVSMHRSGQFAFAQVQSQEMCSQLIPILNGTRYMDQCLVVDWSRRHQAHRPAQAKSIALCPSSAGWPTMQAQANKDKNKDAITLKGESINAVEAEPEPEEDFAAEEKFKNAAKEEDEGEQENAACSEVATSGGAAAEDARGEPGSPCQAEVCPESPRRLLSATPEPTSLHYQQRSPITMSNREDITIALPTETLSRSPIKEEATRVATPVTSIDDDGEVSTDREASEGESTSTELTFTIHELLCYRYVAPAEPLEEEERVIAAVLPAAPGATPSEADHVPKPPTAKLADGPSGGVPKGKLTLSSWRTSVAISQKQARGRQGIAEKPMDLEKEIARKIKSILNKLTLETFDRLSTQLLELRISTSAMLEMLITEVFEKAIMQHHFSGMYADMCCLLQQHFEKLEAMSFKRILLTVCQAAFEKHMAVARGDTNSVPSTDDEEAAFLQKRRMIGTVKFISALFARNMLSKKVFWNVAAELIELDRSDSLECLAVLLTDGGYKLEEDATSKVHLDDWVMQIKKMVSKQACDRRIACLLKDVLDLRKAGWVTTRPAALEEPKKLDEMRKQGSSPIAHTPTARPRVSLPTPSLKRSITKSSDGSEPFGSMSASPTPLHNVPEDADFDLEAFREEVCKMLKEFRDSHCQEEASRRLASLAVASTTQQEGAWCTILTEVVQEGSSVVRAGATKLALDLFRPSAGGRWDSKALGPALTKFAEGLEDLVIDVPTLPLILQLELLPKVSQLVAEGIIPEAVEAELARQAGLLQRQ